jgi:hypothetical protein
MRSIRDCLYTYTDSGLGEQPVWEQPVWEQPVWEQPAFPLAKKRRKKEAVSPGEKYRARRTVRQDLRPNGDSN